MKCLVSTCTIQVPVPVESVPASSAPGGGLNDMERFNAITEISHE